MTLVLNCALPDTADLAAQLRGLSGATKSAVPGRFVYTNILDCEYDDAKHDIQSVLFNTSRYGKHHHVITFDELVTEKVAIEAVEAYLSEPLTEEYYNKIKEDTFHQIPWEEAKKEFRCRGATLTNSRFIEDTEVDEDGQLSFFVGS